MQKILSEACFVAFVLSFAYCNKEKERMQTDAQLQGTWELRQAQSSMVPTIVYQPGNGNRLRFTNTAYERYANDTLSASGTYHLVSDTTVVQEVGMLVEPGQFKSRIVFENDSSRRPFFQITGNQLTLLSGYFPTDGGSRDVYEKLNDSTVAK